MNAAVQILDQIGWEPNGDRDNYPLQLDVAIATYMKELGEEARKTLEGDLRQGELGAAEAEADRGAIEAAGVVVAAFERAAA
jgi:hypothetical protein